MESQSPNTPHSEVNKQVAIYILHVNYLCSTNLLKCLNIFYIVENLDGERVTSS